MTNKRAGIVFITLLVSLSVLGFGARGQGPGAGDKKLEQQAIRHSEESFIEGARRGDLKTVETFLAAGASPDTRDRRDRDSSTVLMVAALAGQTDVVRALIGRGADVKARSASGRTALVWAAWRGRTGAAQALLDGGSEVNAQDSTGTTALLYALSGRHTLTAQTLLTAKDIAVNLRRADGTNALMVAVALGDAGMVRALLDKGADVNTANQKGHTVLMYAATKGDLKTVRVLLAKGADVEAQDHGGTTASILARQQGHTDVVKALRAKKAEDDDTWP